MTPTIPSVDPLPLPAPVWLLWSLLALTFVLHVVPMNLVLGGSIVGLVARLRARRDRHAARLASLVAQALPVLIAATVTMGVAALLFLQALYGRLFFTAAVLIAAPWLAVVPILIAGYYAAYAGRTSRRPVFAWVVALAFLAIAFIYANAMGLLLRPQEFLARFQSSASGLHLDLDDPTLIPRFLHVLLASLAVTGLTVAAAGRWLRDEDPGTRTWMMRHGVTVCVAATVLNLVPGFWWLAVLPQDVILSFMGRNAAATACLAGGVLLALAAVAFAIPGAFGEPPAGTQAAAERRFTPALLAALACLVVSVIAMVLVRDFARTGILQAAGVQPPSSVAPQWGPMGVFAALLVAAVATVTWMVYRLARPPVTSQPAESSLASFSASSPSDRTRSQSKPA